MNNKNFIRFDIRRKAKKEEIGEIGPKTPNQPYQITQLPPDRLGWRKQAGRLSK
jgi:hypothetical protein